MCRPDTAETAIEAATTDREHRTTPTMIYGKALDRFAANERLNLGDDRCSLPGGVQHRLRLVHGRLDGLRLSHSWLTFLHLERRLSPHNGV